MQSKPWSVSAIMEVDTCAHKYYRTRVKKDVPMLTTKGQQEGISDHKSLELRVQGGSLPARLKSWDAKLFNKLDALDCVKLPEHKVAINKDLQSTSFFAADVWGRGVIDLLLIQDTTASVFDYKLGKVYPSELQLKTMALFVFCIYPDVQTVYTAYVWIRHNDITRYTYTRSEMTDMWQDVYPYILQFEREFKREHWAPKANGLCKNYCPIKLCPHHGK